MRDLKRLFQPKSIAVIGGGAWCTSVVEQCLKMGFRGDLWPVHPKKKAVADVATYCDLSALPGVPDAVFIGVNRNLTINMVRSLREMGAGGAVCFASGFREAQAEMGDGADLQAALLDAAGAMPILGPNCYGFINYLDGALLWPDQHGGRSVESGVAIVMQSSNMAINVTMQARGLPLAYVATAGNQAQTGLSEIGLALLRDSRVTTLGLHIEGIGDLTAFEALASEARRLGKRIVALKAGKSEQAQAAAVSHTASLAGSDAGARALLKRLGIAQVESLPAFLESLKLLHFAGPLGSNRLASMSCSGGEASLMADSAEGRGVCFPALSATQLKSLRETLGPMVALSNPLDYHTFIWNDAPRMAEVFAAMLEGEADIGCIIVDFPRADLCDPSAWDCVIEAGAIVMQRSQKPLALVATLPEAMSEDVARRAIAAGMIPMHGLDDALSAIEAASGSEAPESLPVLRPGAPVNPDVLSESQAKTALASHGLATPSALRANTPAEAAAACDQLTCPVVLKGTGVAHKTEAGLVALNLTTSEAVAKAAEDMRCDGFLVEEMTTGAVAELLVGVLRDPAHGFVLTLGAGGTLTEILSDTVSLLLPVTENDVVDALQSLRIAPVLNGYRGKAGCDLNKVAQAVLAVQDYVTAHAERLEEVEINPLICTETEAIAVDALIRIGEAS
ncbi:acetate--CoA ligase family protein [Roseovarius phycicola]|uniref:Acetate--CoA ligase family protein n=1 Tax=Roseovarius phycicola TaxID=3080976 RepID=A0ABZ2HJU6_9RHOB